MPYGSMLADTLQSSTAGTPPQFNDGNSVQVGTLCRAWVNLNGVTTATVRASFNVSSVTRNGAGDYTVNFTTALPDANYAPNVSFGNYSAAGLSGGGYSNATRLAASFRMLASNAAQSGAFDTDTIYISVFR